ncbi:hypothetical protein UAY_02809 [Enterococcus moraviensis ATCC BAA-383]|uniref:Uncharacterized protein n=1 Tax=Enterococcus moraviensis ATCC BAA-383 TaxID=1158609 RepID=R2SUH3_9ENTE|nr:hypothetical protein [Enterococcus moraviensis]EOH96441.1 hypothetical protein UAY_02809 [Enterococcus moraviensis ATCC BAA-383]EOT65867.1 hypothetical protein I586_02136 [Enterococcus moraviensis ATCC BAA-383]OJG68363.1 hypothetical protein RV09_GL001610 [Enterococcus moraviensis]
MNTELGKIIGTSEKEIVTEQLTIKDNLLKFNDMTMQLSNISQIYDGKLKFQLSKGVIFLLIISLMGVSTETFRTISFLGLLCSGGYIFLLYQKYMENRIYLFFILNSGQTYRLMFKDKVFLDEVKLVIEASFNNKHSDYTINVAEQKIVNGNQHIINGSHSNVNFGVQEDHSHTNHISESFNQADDHSFNVGGNVTNSSVQSATSESEMATSIQENKVDPYDWGIIEDSLEKVIETIKIASPVKQASEEALEAARAQDVNKFESVIKRHKAEFLSELFQNTVSGVLAQVITKIFGLG